MIRRAKRQHTVSRSYLRAWADDTGRVLYVDKAAGSAKLIGTKAVFSKRDFVTFSTTDGRSDELEREFARVESLVIPKVREYVSGADEAQHHRSVKALIALHFGRSTSFGLAYERVGKETVSKLAVELSNDETFHQVFYREVGRRPLVGEVDRRVWDNAEHLWRRNSHFASCVQGTYNKALDWILPMHVQRATVPDRARCSLIVADSPVILLKQGRGTSTVPPALNEADFLWFPLGPKIGVTLTSRPQAPVIIDRKSTVRMNLLVWEFAHRYVVGDPRADLNRSLGYPTRKVTIPAAEPSTELNATRPGRPR